MYEIKTFWEGNYIIIKAYNENGECIATSYDSEDELIELIKEYELKVREEEYNMKYNSDGTERF